MAANSLEKAGMASAVVAALASSLCCILPVLAVVFGLSAFGLASVFETLRPYFLVLALAGLGFSFYRVYFRREACDDAQACSSKRVGTVNHLVLWFGLIGVIAMASFPYYSGFVLAAVDRPSASAEPPAAEPQAAAIDAEAQNRKTVTIAVSGMTCEDCATHLNTALKRIKGVLSAEASYPKKNVTVVYDPRQVTIDRIRQGVTDAGYDPQ